MLNAWSELNFWQTGEWDAVKERLEESSPKFGRVFNPSRDRLFYALDLTPIDRVRVVMVGQDPYPDSKYATGLAFSIPAEEKTIPISLANILTEYQKDLGYPLPSTGNLEKWAEQGVLLWNAYPSVQAGKPLSHRWTEWEYLTKEILEELDKKPVVFVFVGSVAKSFEKFLSPTSCVLSTGHPSPRGQLNSKSPFIGSRIFSTINDKLNSLGLEKIDWRLP